MSVVELLRQNDPATTSILILLDENPGADLLAEALGQNPFVTNIAVDLANVQTTDWGALLRVISARANLESMSLERYFSVAEQRNDVLPSFAQCLIRSASVWTLKFRLCFFNDEDSTALFQSILQEKQKLTSLSLELCSFRGGQVYDAIISNTLSRPDSALRTLDFESILALFTVGQLQNLFRAVEKSKLEHFKIGEIHSHEQLRALTQSIPSMRIKELTVILENHLEQENAKRGLLHAVKENFSLQALIGRCNGRDLFNDDDKLRLVFYADRNERLDQWVDNPEKVDCKVWPEALKLAERAGPDSLFRGLQSALGSDYVSLGAKRRRLKSP